MKTKAIFSMLAMATLATSASAGPIADYGDAPASYGDAWALDGSRVYLGSVAPDYEAAPYYAAAYGVPAIGDESNGTAGMFEENGVQFLGSYSDSAGTIPWGYNRNVYYAGHWGKATFTVHATDHTSLSSLIYVDGWIDWGHDGSFQETNFEHVVSMTLDPQSSVTWSGDDATITAMFWIGYGPNGPFYSRFRVNYGEGVNAATGQTLTGEVEDFGDLLHGQECPEPAGNLLLLGGLIPLFAARQWRRRT